MLVLIDMPRAYRLHFFLLRKEQGYLDFTGEQTYVKDIQVPKQVSLKIKGQQRKIVHAFKVAM